MSFQWPEGRRTSVATHESGHALCYWVHGLNPAAVSLTFQGGGACYPPEVPKGGGPYKFITALACLCGEAAERVILGSVKAGGSPQDHAMFREYIMEANQELDWRYREMPFDALKSVYEDLATELCTQHANRIERLAEVIAREEFLSKGRVSETLYWEKPRRRDSFAPMAGPSAS